MTPRLKATKGGQFGENGEKVIYSVSDQDSDSGDNEDTAGLDRSALNRESSERMVYNGLI